MRGRQAPKGNHLWRAIHEPNELLRAEEGSFRMVGDCDLEYCLRVSRWKGRMGVSLQSCLLQLADGLIHRVCYGTWPTSA